MTPKEFLLEYRELDKEINSMVSESVRLRRLSLSIGGTISNTGGGNSSAGGAARFEQAIDKVNDLETKINEKIDGLINKRAEIETALESVNDTVLRTLLRNRYINGYTFERCAVEQNYCWRWILDLHGKALNEVEKYINRAC
ncbi:MAG: hypothetical protein ACYCWE_20985 [Eubacteriales bacterium]